MSRHQIWRSIQAAVVFLTRLPVGGKQPFSQQELQWCSAFFPLVGLALGAALSVVYGAALAVGLSPWSAAVTTLCISLIITGGLHEDGLADTADALGGGYTRAQIFEILKDSRIGTYGAAALIMGLIARVVGLATLEWEALPALMVIESLSRAPPVLVMTMIPYAKRPHKAKSKDVATGTPLQAMVAMALAAMVILGAGLFGVITGSGAIGILLVLTGVTVGCTYVCIRAVGGMTGDFLGAIQQLNAIALWLIWSAQ